MEALQKKTALLKFKSGNLVKFVKNCQLFCTFPTFSTYLKAALGYL